MWIDHNGHIKLTDFGLSRMGLVNRQKLIASITDGSNSANRNLGSVSLTSTPTSSNSGSFPVTTPHPPTPIDDRSMNLFQ